MTHASLFSGIGGFDLAAQWMGWKNLFSCEIAEFPRSKLKKHFPNTIHYEDIRETGFIPWRGAVDVLTGGFPCQPYSVSGLRLGKEDDRHLWPEMLRAIKEIRPRWVVGENVPGLLTWNRGMVFEEVQADLEAETYETIPFLLPAAGVGAPHRRDRIWFIAHASSLGRGGYDDEGARILREQQALGETWPSADPINEVRIITNTHVEGLEKLSSIKEYNQFETVERSGAGWERFPTTSGICRRDDGVPNRVDRIKALGNSVVPEVVYQIFKSIQAYEIRD